MRSSVIGASGGIGAALLGRLSLRGEVIGISRSKDGLDLTDEASIARVPGTITAPVDMVIVATAALEIAAHRPEKSIRVPTPDAMTLPFAVNALGPAVVLKHALRLLPKDRPARFAGLSACVGSIGDNALSCGIPTGRPKLR